MYMNIYGVEITIQLPMPAPIVFNVGNRELIMNMIVNAAIHSLSDAFSTNGLMMGVVR